MEDDGKLIECWRCKRPLNGKSLWIVTDLTSDPVELCERCYSPRIKLRQQVWEISDGKCYYCGREIFNFKGRVTHPQAFTIDHVKPRSKGGRNTIDNCVASCLECNGRKAASFLEMDEATLRDKE